MCARKVCFSAKVDGRITWRLNINCAKIYDRCACGAFFVEVFVDVYNFNFRQYW